MNLSGADFRLLQIFDCVVRNQGFSAAQIELGLSQPTISNHISTLEDRLGVKLCQRGRRGFSLTEKGKVVHDIATSLLQSIDTHSHQLAALKGQLSGRLRVALVDCVATDPLMKVPEAIHAMATQAPNVHLSLAIEKPQSILSRVAEGEIHIGIGGFDNPVAGLMYEDLYTESHALYCGMAHPLFGQDPKSIDESQLDTYPRVHRGYWSQQKRTAVRVRDGDRQVDDIESQLIMVLSGHYLGLLPDHVAKAFLEDGRLCQLPIESTPYSCTLQLVTRSGAQPQVIELFCRLVREASVSGVG